MNRKRSSSASEYEDDASPKRQRRSPIIESNGNGTITDHNAHGLPPLSLSILGIEPMDEFIREVADFIHHMIATRTERVGNVEVEAKVGILRDKATGQRFKFPVLVETSTYQHSVSNA